MLGLACAAQPAAAQTAPTHPVPDEPSIDAIPEPPPPKHRLVWNEDWPRFRPIGYLATSASVLGALAVTFFMAKPTTGR